MGDESSGRGTVSGECRAGPRHFSHASPAPAGGDTDEGVARPARLEQRVNLTDGVVTITDANTTIAYCRYDPSGVVEYLFVGPSFRRRGYAGKMLDIVEARLGITLRFDPPISPLGRNVVESYRRRRSDILKDDCRDAPSKG